MSRVRSARHRTLRVLVVDDDKGDVLMIQEALTRDGQQRSIQVAGDGQDAIDLLRLSASGIGVRPDLILLDLNLPRVDGREVLKTIKADRGLLTIPVVVFTTSGSPRDIGDCYDRYANAYVTKPLTLDEFTTTVQLIEQFFTTVAALPDHPTR